MLYVIPIESYNRRYSGLWNQWFPIRLRELGVPHVFVWPPPELSVPELGNADVLDVFATHRVKSSQLDHLVRLLSERKIRDGDVLLFHTLWFSGLDSLLYIRKAAGIDFRITGVLHAGAYDPWDFRTRLHMDDWARPVEKGWFLGVDRIFVASNFHKKLIISYVGIPSEKIFVTRLPFYSAEVAAATSAVKKEPKIAYPHRLVPEKTPETIDVLLREFGKESVVVTRQLTRTRQEYYDLLATCAVTVSNSRQETFGYSMLEAAALGSTPVVPRRLCYPEMYPEEFLFNDEDDMINKVAKFIEKPMDPRPHLLDLFRECEKSIDRMVDLALNRSQ
ncbi:MAG: hypothetical protein AAGI91_16670 [Bacteroidota bacterium]